MCAASTFSPPIKLAQEHKSHAKRHSQVHRRLRVKSRISSREATLGKETCGWDFPRSANTLATRSHKYISHTHVWMARGKKCGSRRCIVMHANLSITGVTLPVDMLCLGGVAARALVRLHNGECRISAATLHCRRRSNREVDYKHKH